MSDLLPFLHEEAVGGQTGIPQKGELDRAIAYLREHQEVRDVILSGEIRSCCRIIFWSGF